ncbi:MAG: flagellar protein export ATPase FliI [Candidatus Margulisbacteria bacterium GWF2_35_9]|nr:MAG: flagellar protein export ATPase FliI [Candidatus Margulisbacteria bacterium GWF2_35_9]
MSKVGLQKYIDKLPNIRTIIPQGRITDVSGLVIGATGPRVPVGEICIIRSNYNQNEIFAEIVGFREDKILLMPLGDMEGISSGDIVESIGETLKVSVSDGCLGRVLDGLGRPMDDKGPIKEDRFVSVNATPPNPLKRRRIKDSLGVGIKAIDGCLTIGRGQRIGIFSGSGVGKSTLLGMIARNTEADINVIALIGERGREVKEFIENSLGEEGLKRSVVIVATSDQPALIRIKGALTATAIAEYFRDKGKDVLFMMDSVTRFSMAQREVGLTIGEPPTTKGYPPSVFALMPKLMERAGTSDVGSITGIYTVLVDSDDMNEPIADTARSILDGHIVLDRKIASKNIWPAIDILPSLSRVMPEVVTKEHMQANYRLREMLTTYRDAEDLINIGAYVDGSNPKIDAAKKIIDAITDFLTQAVEEKYTYKEEVEMLIKLIGKNK